MIQHTTGRTEDNNIKHLMYFKAHQIDIQIPFSFQQKIGKASSLKKIIKRKKEKRQKIKPIKINGMIWFCLA